MMKQKQQQRALGSQSRRRRSRLLWLSVVTLVAAVILITLGPKILFETSHWITERVSRNFLLEEIEWQEIGDSNLSAFVTQELLWQTSGLRKGDEVLKVQLSEIEARLLSIPWIESVQIQKKIPSSLLVQYSVHAARALLLKKNQLWFLSNGGQIIAPASEMRTVNSSDLPVVIPALTSDGGELDAALSVMNALEEASRVVYEVRLAKDRIVVLSELPYLSAGRKLELWFRNGDKKDVGEAPADLQIDSALNRLNRVAQYLIKNNILVSSIDLRGAKKVVVNVGKRS